jgi:AraC-like DNA-binding protein
LPETLIANGSDRVAADARLRRGFKSRIVKRTRQDVVNLGSLTQSHVLSVVRYTDPEQAVSRWRAVNRRLLPLAGDFELLQANLALGRLRLVMVKRPACFSEVHLDRSQIGIGLPMSDSSGLTLDGLPIEQPALVSYGLTVPHRIYQPVGLTLAGIFMPATSDDRGWPEPNDASRLHPIRASAAQKLRALICDIVVLASRDPSRFSRESVVAGIEQSLLEAIDHAHLTAPAERSTPAVIGKHVKTCRLADEFIRSRPEALPSSADVAAAAGVTIRTLHNAMVAVHGMSLQKFVTLSRLWSARAALLRSDPEVLVKTIAFDHGFWHLGRFSRAYRAFFGECPSATLAQQHAGKAVAAAISM